MRQKKSTLIISFVLSLGLLFGMAPNASAFWYWYWDYECAECGPQNPWVLLNGHEHFFVQYDLGNSAYSVTEEWSSVFGSSLTLVMQQQAANIDPTDHLDGASHVGFVGGLGSCDSCRGMTWIRMDKDSRYIQEADIMINVECSSLPDESPNVETQHTVDNPPPSKKRAFLTLFGYAIGLSTESSEEGVMNKGNMIERLLADDIYGVRYLYPEPIAIKIGITDTIIRYYPIPSAIRGITRTSYKLHFWEINHIV